MQFYLEVYNIRKGYYCTKTYPTAVIPFFQNNYLRTNSLPSYEAIENILLSLIDTQLMQMLDRL